MSTKQFNAYNRFNLKKQFVKFGNLSLTGVILLL